MKYRNSQKATSCTKTRYMKSRSLRLVEPVPYTAHPFTQPPMLYSSFQLARHPQMPLPMGHLHHRVIYIPCTHPTQHNKLHLDWFSHFGTARYRESLYFTVCIKTQLQKLSLQLKHNC